MNTSYDTLSQAITHLQNEGYKLDFNLKSDCIECQILDLVLNPEQFNVDKVYRFEGDSNPDDSSILFAISSVNFKIKGLLIDAYGAYSEALTPDMINKLKYKP